MTKPIIFQGVYFARNGGVCSRSLEVPEDHATQFGTTICSVSPTLETEGVDPAAELANLMNAGAHAMALHRMLGSMTEVLRSDEATATGLAGHIEAAQHLMEEVTLPEPAAVDPETRRLKAWFGYTNRKRIQALVLDFAQRSDTSPLLQMEVYLEAGGVVSVTGSSAAVMGLVGFAAERGEIGLLRVQEA